MKTNVIECGGKAQTLKFLPASIFLTLSLAFLPAIGFSGDGPQQPADNKGHFEAAASRLNLSAEQKEKIKALREAQKQEMQALLQQMKAKNEEIRNALNTPGATRESIAPLVAELKGLHAQMVDTRINNIFAIKEMLSAEQFGKLKQFRQQQGDGEKGRGRMWLEKWRSNREKRGKTKQEE